MDNKELLEKVREILGQYVETDPSEIREETLLAEELGLTSFAFMSMMGEFEDTFDITVDESELVGVKTVGDVIEYIKKKSE